MLTGVQLVNAIKVLTRSDIYNILTIKENRKMAYRPKLEMSADKTITIGGASSEGKPNPTKIEGFYLGAKTVDSDFGPGKLHIFQTAEGNVGVWGKTHLNGLLSPDLTGTMVLVTFAGMKAPSKKGRRPSYSYKVQYDPENTIDITGLAATAEETEVAGDDNYYESNDESYETESDTAEQYDTVVAKAATSPSKPATAPSAERQAKVRALLAGKK